MSQRCYSPHLLFYLLTQLRTILCMKMHDIMVPILNRLDIYSIININVIGTILPVPQHFRSFWNMAKAALFHVAPHLGFKGCKFPLRLFLFLVTVWQPSCWAEVPTTSPLKDRTRSAVSWNGDGTVVKEDRKDSGSVSSPMQWANSSNLSDPKKISGLPFRWCTNRGKPKACGGYTARDKYPVKRFNRIP